jgi:uncharacterized Zn finger protein
MNEEEFSDLPEGEVTALATTHALARGRNLFDANALEGLERRGHKISAQCPGRGEKIYSLSANISGREVDKAHCSCSYGGDGLCNHLIALLLAWSHTPEAFAVAKTRNPQGESALFRELLERDRDELARLICSLVETEPKLRTLVKRALRVRLTESEIAKTRRAVKKIIDKAANPHYHGSFAAIASELKFHLRSAASLETVRPTDALRLHLTILEGMMSDPDPYIWDERGSLIGSSADCMEAIKRLMTADHRHAVAEVAAHAFIFDLRLGGLGFAGESEEILLDADEDMWRAAEPILDAALVPPDGGGKSRAQFEQHRLMFIRSEIIKVKSARMEERGDAVGVRQLMIESGTPMQQVTALIEDRDFDTAMIIAQANLSAFRGLQYQLLDQLEAAGEWPRARAWAEKNELKQWLATRAAVRGEKDALKLNLELFQEAPSLEQWNVIMRIAPAEEHVALKVKLRERLKGIGAHDLLFDIALEDNDVTEAWTWWEELGTWGKEHRYLAFAKILEQTHPDKALKLWNERVESHISRRTREAYRRAAKALKNVRRLLEKQGRYAEWQATLGGIQQEYPNLRALYEELKDAKLTA